MHYLLKARFYRFFSYLFLGAVAVIFAYIYYVKAEGSIGGLMRDALLLPMILVPAIPALITMSIASKAEQKFHEEYDNLKEQEKAAERDLMNTEMAAIKKESQKKNTGK